MQLHLSPNRKYQPRIHVVEETEEGVKVSCSTYVFPETTFIAVTTYQNEEVSDTFSSLLSAFGKDRVSKETQVITIHKKTQPHFLTVTFLGIAIETVRKN